jgi:hypothetical protein
VTLVYAILAGTFAGVVQASFIEWAFHRYWLHRPWLPKGAFTAHTLVHHQLCKHDDTFHVVEEEQHEALTFQWWGGPLLIAINVTPWVLLAWWFSALGWNLPALPFVIALGVAFALYYAGYEGLHYLMHMPSIPWIERMKYFQFIKKHHRIHHIYMNRNLNVLLPLADLCLGTLVTAMPEAKPTPASAREIARRNSKARKKDGVLEQVQEQEPKQKQERIA